MIFEYSNMIFDQDDQKIAWIDSKMDGDNKTVTKAELAQFLFIILPQ